MPTILLCLRNVKPGVMNLQVYFAMKSFSSDFIFHYRHVFAKAMFSVNRTGTRWHTTKTRQKQIIKGFLFTFLQYSWNHIGLTFHHLFIFHLMYFFLCLWCIFMFICYWMNASLLSSAKGAVSSSLRNDTVS